MITKIKYVDLPQTIKMQRQIIFEMIKKKSNSHLVYPGLKSFGEGKQIPIELVPGVGTCLLFGLLTMRMVR